MPEVPGHHPGMFVVELDGVFIGKVVLDRRDPSRPGHISESGDELEVSYTFLPVYWGRGFATEAVEAALGWAAAACNDNEVVLCTQTANEASLRLALRLGFSETERFEEFGTEQWFGQRALPRVSDRAIPTRPPAPRPE